ncbi:MAG: SocA family protein, partial [Firmicutes bacterium]|nr:SocA family protein [Bacillota bacterium]
TGLTYAKMPRGPMPDKFKDILDYLEEKEIIKIETTYDGDYKKIDVIALKEIDKTIFEADELNLINKAKEYVKDRTAKELSELSHEGLIWNSTDDHKFISYDKVKDLKMKI